MNLNHDRPVKRNVKILGSYGVSTLANYNKLLRNQNTLLQLVAYQTTMDWNGLPS